MKQRASKHCFHTEGCGSQANFWISWETKASERFLPIISSPSMVVINLFGMKWVVLSQRVTASPGNLLLHLQLCLCPRLDAGKLLVVLTLNFCHCAWPFHRLSSELSLDCLLLQSSKISTQHVHGDVLSSPSLSLHGCCLHNPSACSALTKCWCSPAIPLSARSLQHAVSIVFGWGHQWHWCYCLVWLTWAVVSWEQLSQFRCFAVGKKKVKVKPASSWIIMALQIREGNRVHRTTRWLWRTGSTKGIDKKGPMKSPWLAEGSLVIFMQVHSLRSGLKLPFQKVWAAFTWQRDRTLCQCFASCGQNDFKISD